MPRQVIQEIYNWGEKTLPGHRAMGWSTGLNAQEKVSSSLLTWLDIRCKCLPVSHSCYISERCSHCRLCHGCCPFYRDKVNPSFLICFVHRVTHWTWVHTCIYQSMKESFLVKGNYLRDFIAMCFNYWNIFKCVSVILFIYNIVSKSLDPNLWVMNNPYASIAYQISCI